MRLFDKYMEDINKIYQEIILKKIKDLPPHKMHFYDIKDAAGLNEEHTEAIKLGVSDAWNSFFPNNPQRFDIVVAQRIIEDNGELSNMGAQFLPDTKQIIFGDENIRGRNRFPGFSNTQKYLLIGAHEATHLAQVTRGDILRPFRSMTPEEYQKDPHEHEAWTVSLRVFRKHNPYAAMQNVHVGKKIYHIPEK